MNESPHALPILVTGAAGRIGSVGRTVTELLLARGFRVLHVRVDDERATRLRALGADVVVGDLLDIMAVHPAIKGCERVCFGMSVFPTARRQFCCQSAISIEETMMRMYYCLSLGALLSVVTNICAGAEIDLIGRWTGKFNGVQIEIPSESNQLGFVGGEPKKFQGPRFVEASLQIAVETQRQGLAIGTWSTGEFKQQFVCAQISPTVWNCVDRGGRASLEVRSNTEMKVCYLDNRQGARGAGCAELRKVQ